MLWIEKILQDNTDIDPKRVECSVEDAPDDEETVLGVIEGRPRILWEIARRFDELADKKRDAYNDMPDGKKNKELRDKTVHDISSIKNEADALRELFWVEIKNAMPAAADARNGIGIRKNWQVVALPEEKSGSLSGHGIVIVGYPH